MPRSEEHIRTAFLVNLLFTLIEFAGGILTNSLAMTADALLRLPGVHGIHDTHLWALDGEHHFLTTHLVGAGLHPGGDLAIEVYSPG